MRRLLLPLFVLVLLPALRAAEPVWHTDLKAAAALARAAKKPLLIDFTGSDWCGWCVRLKKEVFHTQAFKDWAAATVILVEADFPRGKALDPAIKAQNDQLAEHYAIRGFPTIVFTDAKGVELARSGYIEGGPSAWIADAKAKLGGR